MADSISSVANQLGLGDALVQIADKIGVTVQQMYTIMVEAQVTIAIIQIIFILVDLISAVIIFGIVIWFIKKYCNDELDWGVALFLTIVGWLILSMILTLLYRPVIALMCPEYTALQEIITVFSHIR